MLASECPLAAAHLMQVAQAQVDPSLPAFGCTGLSRVVSVWDLRLLPPSAAFCSALILPSPWGISDIVSTLILPYAHPGGRQGRREGGGTGHPSRIGPQPMPEPTPDSEPDMRHERVHCSTGHPRCGSRTLDTLRFQVFSQRPPLCRTRPSHISSSRPRLVPRGVDDGRMPLTGRRPAGAGAGCSESARGRGGAAGSRAPGRGPRGRLRAGRPPPGRRACL